MSDDHTSRFVGSFVSSGIAECVTLPIDVAKVRLQVQHRSASGTLEYNGMFDVWKKICTEETPKHLWSGLGPALVRQCCYSSLSLVLYEPVRNAVMNLGGNRTTDTPSYWQRLLAGGSSGAISIFVFNWTEVLKTKMQTSHGNPKVFEILKQVYKTEGIVGFWAGIQPNIARTFLVNAAELGTYDEAKHQLIPYVGDNAFAHVGASGIAGTASALTSTPADVIKTRLMNSAGQSHEYSGVFNAIKVIYTTEGVSAFYKGFFPIILRKVVWCR